MQNQKQQKKSGKEILKIVLIIVFIIIVVLVGVSNYLVSYAIGRSGDGGDRQVSLDVEETKTESEQIMAQNREAQATLTEAFLESVEPQNVQIISEDGLKLSGVYYENADSHKWVILIHGYRSSHESMTDFAQRYYDQGYQVLTPDLRACGDSEGDYLGMGWLDRKDMLGWINWTIAQDPGAEIVLHGVSMGAATVLMTSGERTADAVKVFIEDCGYTSVWDVFASELKLRFHLPEYPILYVADGVANFRAEYSFREASALEQVAKCEKPMLFIHGTADDFIPFEMEDELYQAKPGDNKEKIEVLNAGHGESDDLLGDEYWEDVFGFIDTYME